MRYRLLALMLWSLAPNLLAQQAVLPSRTLSVLPGLEDRPVMRALRLQDDEIISVDGRRDEEAWERAVPATDFVQQDPRNGEAATERTEVRILFTKRSLHMGVICFDSVPDKLQGNQMWRDGL